MCSHGSDQLADMEGPVCLSVSLSLSLCVCVCVWCVHGRSCRVCLYVYMERSVDVCERESVHEKSILL